MTIKVGDKIPSTKLKQKTADGVQDVSSDDYFKGKVVIFGLPGAFTPTCSAKHLPGFVEKADEILAKGIDEIACTAANDAFVMTAWGKSADVAGKVTMLADGNAEFPKALGLDADMSAYGMGTRGRRFSMVVNDG